MRAVWVMAAVLALSVPAQAQKATDKKATSKADTAPKAKQLVLDPDIYKPGTFSWAPDLSPTGPIVIVVSLNEQRAHVYRNGIRIAVSTVSSGIKGRDTPSGSYEILQKKTLHHSNLYSNAPMPFMQRLTWDGIALHAGHNPGYAASHGCVRLPRAFSEKLYGITRIGTRVIITDDLTASVENLIHPGNMAPIDAVTGVPVPEADVGTWPVDGKLRADEDKAKKKKEAAEAKEKAAAEAAAVRANLPESSSPTETVPESQPRSQKAVDPALTPQPQPAAPAAQTPENQEKPVQPAPAQAPQPEAQPR